MRSIRLDLINDRMRNPKDYFHTPDFDVREMFSVIKSYALYWKFVEKSLSFEVDDETLSSLNLESVLGEILSVNRYLSIQYDEGICSGFMNDELNDYLTSFDDVCEVARTMIRFPQ